jgi:two-component system OmpR family response regulator
MTADGRCLLAVEDEPRNAALLEAILSRLGHRLEVVGDLTSARAWLEGNTPDLILLDRHLPDGDGLDLIPLVRGSDRLRDVPILLVSASVLPSDELAAAEAGCNGFLPKPVRIRPLLDEVSRLLGEPALPRAS